MEDLSRIHRPEYFVYPKSHTLGFFDSLEDLKEAVRALEDIGIDEESMDLYEGKQGLHALDSEGAEHTVMEKIARNAQKFLGTGEWKLIEDATKELKFGHCLLSVLTKDEATRDEVVNALKSTKVHGIRYVSSVYTQEIEK